jgi:hypothetical protein
MKQKGINISWVYIAIVLLFTQICFGDITSTLNFYSTDFSVIASRERDGNDYSIVISTDKGISQSNDIIGNPELPEKTFCYSLPADQNIDHIIINGFTEIPLATVVGRIKPQQTDWLTSVYAEKPEFIPVSQTVYQTNAMYPQDNDLAVMARQDYVRGVKIVSVVIKPVRYNPVLSEVTLIQSITFTLVTNQAVNRPISPLRQSQGAELQTLSLLRAVVKNAEDLPVNIPHVRLIRAKPGQGYPSPAVPPDCIILTNDQLIHAFSDYGQWLTRKGIPTQIINVATIYNTYPGIDNPEKIRNFVIDRYWHDGLCYLVLGGDLSIIPKRLALPYDTNVMPTQYGMQICDLYYGDVDGIWDYDNDGVFGEQTQDRPDMGVDVLVGRIPAKTPDEVDAWVAKRLRYEQNPGNGQTDYLLRAAVANADEMRDLEHYRDTYYAFPPFFNVDTTALIEQPNGSDINPTQPSGQEFITFLNTQHPHIIATENHGSPDYFATKTRNYNQPPRSIVATSDEIIMYGDGRLDDVETNNQDYLHFSIACDLGMMDCREAYSWWTRFPCYAQHDLFCRGGSVTGRYNTRWGWVFASHPLELAFYSVLFSEESQHRISAAHYMAKLLRPNTLDIDFGNTLFGCPVLTAWTQAPQTLTVNYPRYIELIPGENRSVTIQVKSRNMAAPEVQVALWKDSEIYATGFTDATGRIALTIRPQTKGVISLVCSKPNYIPFQGSIVVSPGVHIEPGTHAYDKASTIKPILIWNPHHFASGDSLLSTLQAAGYQASQTSDLINYLDGLISYSLFVIGGIGEYAEQKVTRAEVNPVLPNLLSYLADGGTIYWEGGRSLGEQQSSLVSYFSFDIYTVIQNSATYLRGMDGFLAGLDSIGYDEGEIAADAISHYPNIIGNVIEAPEAFLPPTNTKACVNGGTMVANFSWAKLNDNASNTRVELAEAIINWFASDNIDERNLPQEFSLRQNYPNPFNASTVIEYGVPYKSMVKIDIFDILGRKVTNIYDGQRGAGTYREIWDATGVPSGIYFYKLTTGSSSEVKSMTIVK